MARRWLGCFLLLAAATGTNVLAAPEGTDDLLRSARLWELKYRPDLARVALDKLLAVERDEPRALLRLGLLELDNARGAEANKVLVRLQAAHPQHPAVRQLADAIRIAGPDRQKWSTARRLWETGESQQARATLLELFPAGPPQGELGVTYWRIIGDSDDYWQQARDALQALLRDNPDDPPFALGLARHLLERDSSREQGLRMLAALSQQDGANHTLVMEVWRKALLRADTVAPPDIVRAYLALQPDDADVAGLTARYAQAAREREQQQAQARAQQQRDAEVAALLGNRELMDAFYAADRAALPALDATLSAAIAQQPQHPALIESIGLLRLQQRKPAEAWDWFERGLRLDPRESGRWRALLRTALYLQLRAPGAPTPDAAVLQASDSLLAGDLAPLSAHALELMQRGETALAEQLLRQLLTLDPVEPAALAGLVAHLAASGREDEAQTRLRELRSQHPAAAEQIAELQLQLLGARVQVSRERGDTYAAMRALDEARALEPNDPWTRYRLAQQYVALGFADDARQWMEAAAQRAPRDADTRYAQALLLSSLDEPAAALDALAQIPPRELSDSARQLQQRLQLRSRLQPLHFLATAGDAAALQRGLATATAAAGDDPVLLALIADARVEFDRKIAAAPPLAEDGAIPATPQAAEPIAAATPTADEPVAAPAPESAAAAVVSSPSRLRELSLALDYRSKPGDDGISAFTHIVTPLEARLRLGKQASGFVQIEPTRAGAGTLPADYERAALYGKVQAYGPAALAVFPAGARQESSGAGLGIGVERGAWRADLGTTPTAFPVHYLVGGLRYSGELGSLDYTLGLSRRPVTSSYLSYAGARDPVTGEIWGGVRATGGSLRLARYERLWSASLTGGYYRLTGDNVLDNRQLALRASGSRTVFEKPGMEVTAGAAATFWRYDENLRYYSFGHGGYYSPQNYLSLSLPLEWTGAQDRWSWQLRGGVSYSHSEEDDMPFYPTDAGLQALAQDSPLPSGFDAPVYEGGPGDGFGYFFNGTLEYQLLPQLALGGRAELDRADYYDPNFFTLYLRYTPDAPVIGFPPKPPQRYSDY